MVRKYPGQRIQEIFVFVQLQEDNENLIELAAMVPSDLSWTEIKKNAILSYNVF